MASRRPQNGGRQANQASANWETNVQLSFICKWDSLLTSARTRSPSLAMPLGVRKAHKQPFILLGGHLQLPAPHHGLAFPIHPSRHLSIPTTILQELHTYALLSPARLAKQLTMGGTSRQRGLVSGPDQRPVIDVTTSRHSSFPRPNLLFLCYLLGEWGVFFPSPLRHLGR